MTTHGYEKSRPWRLALALVSHIDTLADGFAEQDKFGLTGKLRSTAVELPVLAALCFEQHDYDQAKTHAANAADAAMRMLMHAQIAEHLKLLTPRQTADLHQRLHALDQAFDAMLDELFEDDGEPAEPAEAA